MKTTLSNGLRLFCRTNDSAEIVSIMCMVRAGLPDEPDNQPGLAALTSELLIQGTTTHSKTTFLLAQANAGGAIRSLPGFDFTEVSIVTTHEEWEKALKLVGDVVSHPRFDADDLKEAKEEIKRRAVSLQDDFTGASYQSLCAQLYRHSPYGRPIAGYADSIDRITVEDIKKFWKTNYVQNRMVVSVVGDVDARKGIDLAEKAFKDVPFEPGAQTRPPSTEKLTQPKVELLQRPGPAAQLMVGFLVPGATRENYATYSIMDAIVGGGKRGRMFTNIREKQSLGYDMGSFYQPLLFQSHLVGYVITPPYRRNAKTEQPESVIDLVKTHLLAQYQQLAATPPTDAEVARARNYVIGRYALRQERSMDQAKWLAWNVQMGLGPDFDDVFVQRASAVTKEQIQAAAKGVAGQYALVVTVPDEK